VPLASLVIAEAPAISVLSDPEERQHRYAFAQMTREYFTALADGDMEAIATMIDFYGGAGTFASWPARVRNYAVETTPVNILDWASADGFDLSAATLAALEIPTLVVVGGSSHPAIRRANELLSQRINGAIFATVEASAHFMISTHAEQVARLIAAHVRRAEKARDARTIAVRPLQAAYGMHSSS
jgi:pimeloyl-ACP methyl ester carboxylesterase